MRIIKNNNLNYSDTPIHASIKSLKKIINILYYDDISTDLFLDASFQGEVIKVTKENRYNQLLLNLIIADSTSSIDAYVYCNSQHDIAEFERLASEKTEFIFKGFYCYPGLFTIGEVHLSS